MIISIVSLLCLILVFIYFSDRFQLIVRFLVVVADSIVIVCIVIDIRVMWCVHLAIDSHRFTASFFDTEKSVSLALISVVILFAIMHNIHPLAIVLCRFTSVSAVHRHIGCREIGAFPRVNFSFLRVLRTSKFTQVEVASHWSMNYSCL